MNEEQPVLEITNLRVTFPTESGEVQAVRGVDVKTEARRRNRIRGGKVEIN